MKVIYKYEFPISDIVGITLPYNSRVLTVRVQNGKPFLWAIVDTEENSRDVRRFYVFGTGNPLPEFIGSLKHINTISDGIFVWHIFE